MLLLLHIAVAIGGIIGSTLAVILPSLGKIKVASGLVAATVGSGFLLVITAHVSILQTCISGLVYVAATGMILLAASHRLAAQKVKNDD